MEQHLECDDCSGDNHQFADSVQQSESPPVSSHTDTVDHDPSLQEKQQTEKDDVIIEKKIPPKIKVVFTLCVQHPNVHEAYVKLSNQEKPIALNHVANDDSGYLWTRTVNFNNDPKELRYQYRVLCTRNSKIPFAGALLGKDQSVDEVGTRRCINSKTELWDTFHFEHVSERDQSEIVAKSSIIYTKQLFKSVNSMSINKTLMQIEAMKFSCSQPLVKQTVEWILKTAVNPGLSDVQRLFLSVILGHLTVSNPFSLFTSDSTTSAALDYLLESFVRCAKLKPLLPSSKYLEKIAPLMVKSSSKPSWFTFAAYFYPYLGVKCVLQEKFSVQKCDEKEYLRLMDLLLPALTRDSDDEMKKLNLELLSRVLETAPNQETVLILYKSPHLEYYFSTPHDKFDLFATFYLDRLSDQTTPGKKLEYLASIPRQIYNRMPILPTVVEFIKETKDPKKEQIDALLKLIPFLETRSINDVLTALSSSKSQLIRDVLLKILDDDAHTFYSSWSLITLAEKVQISFKWIMSQLTTKPNDENQTTVEIYKFVNQLMLCKLNIGNVQLARDVCEEIAQKILDRTEFTSIVRAHKYIEESCSETVKECYKTYVHDTLENFPNLVRKVISGLNSPSSIGTLHLLRLGQDLLLYGLEVISLPKDNCYEENILEILDWLDEWKFLLRITGNTDMLRKNPTFRDGRNKWKDLASSIKDGNISPKHMDDIKKREKDISSICAMVTIRPSAPKAEFEREEETFLKLISEHLQVQKDCCEKFQLLQTLIIFAKNVFHACMVELGTNFISELNVRENWRTRRLSELKDEDFWGPLHPLLGPAKALNDLRRSASFKSVAKICLHENVSTSLTQVDLPKPMDIQWLATFLESEVITRFTSEWLPVFGDPYSLTADKISSLLESLKNEKDLDVEVALLEDYFRRCFTSDAINVMATFVKFPAFLKQVKDLTALLETFGLTNETDSAFSTLTTFRRKYEEYKDVSLRALNESMLEVGTIVCGIAGKDNEDIIEVLGRSKELVSFLKEIIDEDIRFLIDAVEEHSDQFALDSSVSDLIDVRGFLAPLIKCGEENGNLDEFCVTLKQSCTVHNKDMTAKLHQCSMNVNSLRGLYTSVANRGELTKEIIANCLKKGVYTVNLQDDGLFEIKMSYEGNSANSEATYSLSEVLDFRSRAHLIVSSNKNASIASTPSDENYEVNFSDFIVQVNLLTEIRNLLSKLQYSGYAKYRKFWCRMEGTNELQDTENKLQKDLEAWESVLSKAREQYYFLNYYRSDQLCILHDYLGSSSQNIDDVLSLIHFVDPNIKKEQLIKYQILKRQEPTHSPHEIVSMIADALEQIFSNTRSVRRPILGIQKPLMCKETVKSGKLFVASLERESPLTANVMLTLYENTSNVFPEPHQVVFCGPQTTWEEIYLVLQRCFTQSKYPKSESLFCIANVELLANEVQFKMINVIKEKQNNVDENYRLALICRGGDHHHIVEEFAQYSHHISGMSDQALSKRLKTGWPDVKMITSTLPGLGKTESIQREVMEKNMNIVTFPISGPLHESKIIQQLKQLNLKKFQCLHLNIGEIDNPLWFDTFLFQLIVTGMVSSGTQFYHLQTTHLYIEIANTLNDRLRESLVIAKHFTRVHLQWCNYKDLLVSSEITSKHQVVCQYLDVFDRGTLESTDVYFTGPHKVKPLPVKRCRELLDKYYSCDTPDTTFTALNTFLAVLADQLLKFSMSAFFKIDNLKSMLEDEARGVRTNLFIALLEESKEFASRSITTCHSRNLHVLSQKDSAQALDKAVASSGTSAQDMVERVQEMIQWEHSNHLHVVFHGASSQSIAAVYRDKDHVPPNVANLLKSQKVKGKSNDLEDFKAMSQEQLQEKLEKIACTKPSKKSQGNLSSSYALTPDNILKMILIILRVRANVPVIIMGETGCGKTSLVRYLANICQIEFFTFSFHAGITEDKVKQFIEEKENQAIESRQQIWVFLDEINTCDHLGLINDIMCHRSLFGQPLSKNLVFLAACNPYKIRPKEQITTAGLEGKNITDEYSSLVYRVHQLPEAMIDYVWDYGSLTPNDEKVYIERMVGKLPPKYQGVLVDLLAESQKFIRKAEKNNFCVSLRDVYRCILLVPWFVEIINQRKMVKKGEQYNQDKEHLQKYISMSQRYDKTPVVKSIVLALAHCYLSRLPTAELRRSYRNRMMNLFSATGTVMTETNDGEVDDFSAIIRVEEEDYLDRMELPSGTAKNAALRENVFVILVSILNRIPVFVVGKPGCSKSLSIQLIRSNLRGRDSKDPFFRMLPQLYVVSYQGSESSTSEGIIKIFKKASKYKSDKKDGSVLPVVLLDEVGLAENSKYNPLKVLHSLLEPGDGQLPDVAVVGISNWALDAAKMNRAIHLSRPEPTVTDLYETGQALRYADFKDQGDHNQDIGRQELQCLAAAYSEYQSKQRHANFHGLRDYYSLIKSLRGGSNLQINMALQRNFGGIPGELTNIQKIFLDKLKEHVVSSGKNTIIPVPELIQENLKDRRARHLMLLTSGDSAIGILKQNLTQLNKEIITIFGSRFEEDQFDDYNYIILSRIILYMERDCILILRDLERIYGSLYDMLNQNYAVVGKRKNCRVALGAHSNPMCHVNDGFRCIVLTDHHKVDLSDPPFLNRFEKQSLRFSDVMWSVKQEGIIAKLRRWVQQISTVDGHEFQFKDVDMFVGFNEDTLLSLVLLHSQESEESSSDEIIQKCKDDLMWIATPDATLRAQKSNLSREDVQQVKLLSDGYFQKCIHHGLLSFMETEMRDQETSKKAFLSGHEIGTRTVVMTYSTIHTDIAKCLGETIQCQIERLSAYKSEKQLTERISNFWSVSEDNLLVLQCKPELDGAHMLLARSIIDDRRSSYETACQKNGNVKQKHVCIIVHLQRRTTNTEPWQFSYLCGWKQVFLDVLEAPSVPLNEIRTKSIPELLTSSIWPLRRIAQNDLMWCFTCIKYTQQQRPLESILHIGKNLFKSTEVYQVIEQIVLHWVDGLKLKDGSNEPWQVTIACDRQALINSSTLCSAMEQHVSRLVRQPLAKIIYFLEKENAWPPHVIDRSGDETFEPVYNEDMWCSLMSNEKFFNMSEIPEQLGAESYILDNASLDLQLPFSQVIIRRVDAVKDLVLEDYTKIKEDESNFDVQLQQIKRYSKIIANIVPEIQHFQTNCYDSYMSDLFDVISADFRELLSRHQRISTCKCAFQSNFKHCVQIKKSLDFYTRLHMFTWFFKEQILDQLRMVAACQQFVRPQVLELLTNQGDALPYKGKDDSEIERKASQEPALHDDVNKANKVMPSDEFEVQKEFAVERSADEPNEINDEECEELKCFENVLVTKYCEEMFPSGETLEKNGGLKSWIRNASLLLSLAFKISKHAPASHFLRLCVDFAKLVLIPSATTKQPLYPLYILNEIAEKLKPEYLDKDEALKIINEDLITSLEEQVKEEHEKHEALQKFIALFYGRCLDTNVDTSGAGVIVKQVLSLDRADLVLTMRLVIYRLLLVEEKESPGVFIDIITDNSIIKHLPCLQKIDEVFKELFTLGLIHHDSYASVMICDLIQLLLKFDNFYSIEDINRSDCELLQCVHEATKILSGDNQERCGLVLLSSVAFLRGFFTMLSNFIARKPNILTVDSSFSHAMSEINSLFIVDSLQTFFLKQLHQTGMSMFEICALCHENKTLPAINGVFIDYGTVPKAVFFSVCVLPELEQVKAAYWRLTKENEKDMLVFLDLCQNSPKHRLALMQILGNMIYLKRAERNLTDKEEHLAKWFSKKFEQFPFAMKEVLLRIIGQEDFGHPQMQLSPESSVDEVEIALLILHISCVLVSGVQSENSPLKQYFLDPQKCKQNYILGHGKGRIYQAFEDRESAGKVASPFTCVCGQRVLFKDRQASSTCPYCITELDNPDPETNCMKTNRNTTTSSKGYSPVSPKHHYQWDVSLLDTNPSVFRALHFIVHASLYSGVAMGISSNHDLSLLVDLKETEVANEYQDPAEFCFDHIKADLKCLTTILCCKKEIAIKVMHLVVERCTELIRGKSLNNNMCLTPEQRLEWEVEFSNIVKDTLLEALGSAKLVKEMTRIKSEENEASTAPQDQIQELDVYPAEPTLPRAQQLKRLFRVTRQPSFKEFHSQFVNASKDFQEKHSFLLLFFARFGDLPKIGNLFHLLKWSRLVSSALTHRVSRKDAKSKSINDFITGHLVEQGRHQDETKSYKESFDNFKEAWNNMRDLVNKELSQNEDKMPRLRETDPIAYCLTESDSGVYLLNAIKILVSLQNSILDEMIFLSTQRQHPPLRFLEKNNNCSGISSVCIQKVKEKEIISFQWSDELAIKYAQNNPEYGHGEEITYDFELMETELAHGVAFGKRYLTGSLNKFIFSNELFNSSGAMLTEIRQLFTQCLKLPDEVRQDLSSVKERRINDAQNLLQDIVVLIFLMKQKLHSVVIDIEMTLETFVDMMSTMLPSPFPLHLLPESRSSIKLKHVAALYEALEDLLADGAIEGLAEQFRQHLPDDMKYQLDLLVNNEDGQIKRQTFLNALRRFVFRYLSSEKSLPDANTPLNSCLKESSLWSPAAPPDPEAIPKEIPLECINSVITYLQELDKGSWRRVVGRQHTTTTTPTEQGAQKPRKTQRKRRVIATFSCF